MVSRQFQKTQLAELIASTGDRSKEDLVGRMKVILQIWDTTLMVYKLTLRHRICGNWYKCAGGHCSSAIVTYDYPIHLWNSVNCVGFL